MGWVEEKVPVVRMFPDYADSVLWLDGPVDYEGCGLSEQLVGDLRHWEQDYYDALVNLEWRTPELAAKFTRDGIRLAQQVADELGENFEVEFQSYEPGAPLLGFRGSGPGSPAAAAAFGQRASTGRDLRERLTRLPAGDKGGTETFGWFAYAPESGTVFRGPAPQSDIGRKGKSPKNTDSDQD